MSRLLLATNNPGKIAELHELLAPLGVECVAPRDLGLELVPEETGTTYLENATFKARAFSAASGLPALADDSGLEVEALGGRPGVESANYGGPGLSASERVQLLLDELRDVPDDRRGARFVAVVVVALPAGRIWHAGGELRGTIAREPRGTGGFGYDPIFYLPERGRTVAELAAEEKNELSHRAQAVQAALPAIREALAVFDSARLSHLDEQGRARMVDVTAKADTTREAVARGRVLMQPRTLQLILAGEIAKGNVLATAQIAGIMAAKRTHELIPLCHPLLLTDVEVRLTPDEAAAAIAIEARVRSTGKTGVEMEALTAVAVAGLTLYDMCKAVDRGMRVTEIRLVRKSGGKSGEIVLE